MFETFVLRLADKDPLMAVASEYMESMTQEVRCSADQFRSDLTR